MTTVISGLLVSSGLGSFFSRRITEKELHRGMVFIVFTVGAIVGAFLGVIPCMTQRFLGLDLVLREFMTIILLFPLGFLMGMPFPLGIRHLRRADPSAIPWAWCINGCFSVMGAVLAVVIAFRAGFSGVLVLAAVVYAGGGAVVLLAFPNLANHGNKENTS
jgi:predicted membrane-bound spermidine synthase